MTTRPNKLEKPENGDWYFRIETTKMERAGITCVPYRVTSKTLKGVWIVPEWCNIEVVDSVKRFRKFVRNDGKKRFAHPTKDEANIAFLYRKRRHIEILMTQLSHAQSVYVLAGGKLPVIPRKFINYEDY